MYLFPYLKSEGTSYHISPLSAFWDQTKGTEMREHMKCHSSKSKKQLRDRFVKVSRFSLVLFHLIILSSVSIGSFLEPSYPSLRSVPPAFFRFGCWSSNLLTLLPCCPPSVSPPQATATLNRPIKAKPRTRPCESTSATILPSKILNTLRMGDADLRFYNTIVQDGWCKSAFLTRACFPCTIHLIMQYIEPVSEWSCWQMFIETWHHSELNFRHRASSI